MVRFVGNCLSSCTRWLRGRGHLVGEALPLATQVKETHVLFILFISPGLSLILDLQWVGCGRVRLSQQGIHFRHWPGRLLMVTSPDLAPVPLVLCE